MVKKYTPEFRAEAVKLSQEIGVRPASERLNINLDPSDRGSQFTSTAFRTALAAKGAIQSMSSVGRCYDNDRM
ncbi:hypothetical protein [Eubacterium aggregans]|uniref:hypothetical protein n=1 Tax=Eubacterium aggregans TaxID=81409 RepID=UPI003F35D8B0